MPVVLSFEGMSQARKQLADAHRIVVKLGPIHIHVPLVPDQDGAFTNPADTSLTVPIPYEAEPGPWTVRVVTAAGLETSDYPLDILADEV